jgi:hypothetical protein
MSTRTLVAGGNSMTTNTLRAGNANGDMAVNINDFSVLATTFGLANGMTGYDARADFDSNNAVNIADFVLLAINFGQMGAPLP